MARTAAFNRGAAAGDKMDPRRGAADVMNAAYRFGEYRLDPVAYELWRGGRELALPRKVFACIVHLIKNRDRAVGRDELMQAIWGHVHLTDNTLGQAIRRARHVLEDDGKEQQIIKTVRDFGYRWAAHVETLSEPSEIAPAGTEGQIALLLPVAIDGEGNGEHAWIRLGIMDLIAQHLRAAGQPMVRSDTVIALLQGMSAQPRVEDVQRLARDTGAQLVLSPRAQVAGARWRIAVRSVLGTASPLNALGEAHDVIQAARIAADQMSLSLGFKPGTDLDVEPALAKLLRKAEAAMLAQQMGAARELIEAAGPDLRERPEVRLQLGWIEYESHQLDAARDVFETLLEHAAVQRDPVLRARVLHGLGGVHFRRGSHRAAQSILEEAMRLHGDEDPRGTRGRIQRLLGFVTLIGGDFARARVHLAQARKSFEAGGDVRGLGALDNNLGVLAILRDRYAEALFHFRNATARQALLNDVDAELRNHANAVEAHLGLLDPEAAAALERQLKELLPQTANTRTVIHANLARALLLDASGKCQVADALLAQVLRAIEDQETPLLRTNALVFRAERLAGEGDLAAAARIAADVVARTLPDHEARQDDGLGRAWLIVVREALARGDLDDATDAAARMHAWAREVSTESPAIHAAIAQAEVAAAASRYDAARTSFERALFLADRGHVPLRTLQVAESYVGWLLARSDHDTGDLERALVIADRLSPYADRDYRAALVQLRVYLACGPQSAWRAALARARSLAGERRLPVELLLKSAQTHA